METKTYTETDTEAKTDTETGTGPTAETQTGRKSLLPQPPREGEGLLTQTSCSNM